jgi:hypothetical protein
MVLLQLKSGPLARVVGRRRTRLSDKVPAVSFPSARAAAESA